MGGTLTFLGTGFYSYSRGVFLPALAEELANGSRFDIAMGFSIAAVTVAFVAPKLGQILDRGSPKRIILIGIVISGVSYLLLAKAQNLWQFYVIVGLGMGLALACMGNLAWHRTIISWFDHWRGRAVAFGVIGASLAGVVMPPLVTSLVDNIGWRSAYVVFAVVTMSVLIPLVYFFLKDRPEEIGEVRDGLKYTRAHAREIVESAEESRVWHWREMIRTPAFWSIGLIFGSMGCVYSAVMLHLFGHMTDIGLSNSNAAYILSATALFAAMGKPVVGWMSDAWGAKVTIWLALIEQAAALMLFAFASSFEESLLAGCLYGFGYSGMSPLRTFSISVAMGSATFGAANGILRIVELPLVISASPLAGYIYDVTGSYANAFLILAALMAFSCIGPFFIRAGGARERRRIAVEAASGERTTPP